MFAQDTPVREEIMMAKPFGSVHSIVSACSLRAILTGAAAAQPATLEGNAAFGDWRADKPGIQRLIKPQDLPPPGATPSSASESEVVPRPAGAMPQVPPGFKIELFAGGLSGPRIIRTAPNGDIFVAETRANRIRILRAADGATKPEVNEVYASGLDRPFGIAFFPNGDNPQYLYVANTGGVVRFAYKSGDLKASGPPETIVASLPRGGHSTRDVVFTPDNKRMLVSVGSGSNDAEGLSKPPGGLEAWSSQHALGAIWGSETDRAGVLAFDPDGKNQKMFATGIRNCVGLAVQPENGAVWCSTNERDGLGDNLVPDYVTRVSENAFYGWPWFYIGDHEDPQHVGAARPERQDHDPRRAAAGAFGLAWRCLLPGQQFSGGISRRCVRRRTWLMEQVEADRLQGDPYPHERRRAHRRL
jgi:glucose/arabinose dehydrogenase